MKTYYFATAFCLIMFANAANSLPRTETSVEIRKAKIVHQTRLIGPESAKSVSNDPFMQEAIDAEASGRITRCHTKGKKRKLAGGGAIYRFNNRYFIISTAHTLYKNGKPKCNKNYVHFQPDRHYKNRSGIKYKRRYQLELPPLNHDEISETNRVRKNNQSYIDDFAILEIRDLSLLNSQVRNADGKFRKRQFLRLLDIPSEELVGWSKLNPIRIIGDRKNYANRRAVVTETQLNCIKPRKKSWLMMHCLDTGAGSSGRPVRTGIDGVIGIHVGGSTKLTTNADFANTTRGNSFIPSWYILRKLRRMEQDGRL